MKRVPSGGEVKDQAAARFWERLLCLHLLLARFYEAQLLLSTLCLLYFILCNLLTVRSMIHSLP